MKLQIKTHAELYNAVCSCFLCRVLQYLIKRKFPFIIMQRICRVAIINSQICCTVQFCRQFLQFYQEAYISSQLEYFKHNVLLKKITQNRRELLLSIILINNPQFFFFYSFHTLTLPPSPLYIFLVLNGFPLIFHFRHPDKKDNTFSY